MARTGGGFSSTDRFVDALPGRDLHDRRPGSIKDGSAWTGRSRSSWEADNREMPDSYQGA